MGDAWEGKESRQEGTEVLKAASYMSDSPVWLYTTPSIQWPLALVYRLFKLFSISFFSSAGTGWSLSGAVLKVTNLKGNSNNF